MENKAKIERLVNFFIEQWKVFARNPSATSAPIQYMHLNDRKYYINRIRNLMDVEERLKTATGSEQRILNQKRIVIRKDFEDLYRKCNNLPREQAY